MALAGDGEFIVLLQDLKTNFAGLRLSFEFVTECEAQCARRIEDAIAHAKTIVGSGYDMLLIENVLDPECKFPIGIDG